MPRRSSLPKLAEEIPFGPALVVRRYGLTNGLNVLVLVDRSAPVLSYQTWFRVGSRHEKPGKTGLAHLFEHLMFNETANLPAGEFDRMLEAAGGETNAATWVDWTFYYENLPRSQLPLAVRLESDRMANLVLRDPQVTSEKEVVANERRYRVDDDVEGAASEQLYARAFHKHPYHWPTIGWMKDIQGFDTRDCEAFYSTYYAPNNATVVLAGDIDEREALALIDEHYGNMKAAPIPNEKRVREPEQRRERRHDMRLPTPTEKLLVGFHAPEFASRDWATLAVLNEVLFGGRSSRIYQELVNETELATETRGSLSPFRDPGLYEMWVSLRPKKKATVALSTIDRELDRLRRHSVTDEELEKAKNRLELAFLQGMETAGGKAEQIGFYDTVLGDPGRVFGRLEEYRSVTRDQVHDAAKRYFDKRRRTVIRVLPTGGEAAREIHAEAE